MNKAELKNSGVANKSTDFKKDKKHIGNMIDTKGVLRTLVYLCMPLMLVFVIDAAYYFVDAWMVQNYVGSEYLSVKAISYSFYKVYISIIIVFVIGTSMAYGFSSGAKKDTQYLAKIINSGLICTMISCFVLFIIMLSAIKPYLTALGFNTEQAQQGFEYLLFYAIGIFFMLIRNVYLRILRIEGKTNQTTIVNLSFYPVAIFFGWYFMNILDMGLMGSGLGFLIGSLFNLAIMLIFIHIQQRKQTTMISFRIRNFVVSWKSVVLICSFGIPASIWNVGFNINDMFQSIAFKKMGYESLFAAYQLATLFMQSIAVSITSVISIVIGYLVGAKKNKDVVKFMSLAAYSLVILTTFSSILLLSLVVPMFNLVSLTLTTTTFWMYAIIVVTMNTFYIHGYMSSLLTATKQTKTATWDALIKFFFIGIPMQLIFYFGIFIPTGNPFGYVAYLPIWSLLSLIYLRIKYVEYFKTFKLQ